MTSQLFTWPNVRTGNALVHVPSFEEMEREARERARAEGLAEGRRQADQELARKVKELQAMREALEAHRLVLEARQVASLAEFVKSVFESLLGATLRIEPEVFCTMLQKAIDTLPKNTTLSIRAHPELASVLMQTLEVTVQADATMGLFSVHVDSDHSSWVLDLVAEFECLLQQGMTDVR